MLSRLHNVALMGIEALGCEIEVDCAEHEFEKAAIVCLRHRANPATSLQSPALALSSARGRSNKPLPPQADTVSC